ncbi:MAG: mechanosensitive ion channel [Vicingaceae bacterium]
MNTVTLNLLESGFILVLYGVLRMVFSKVIDNNRAQKFIQESRAQVIKRVVNIVLLVISVASILLVWGVKQSDLAVLIGSVLTVVGVAFFAQWSLLSNITSSVIIFFNHPLRLNDFITIMEGKDYQIEGRVTSIGLFFVTLENKEGEEITLPNNVFIQKSMKQLPQETPNNDKDIANVD